MSLRTEVTTLMPKIPGNSNPSLTTRLFNAAVAITDGTGAARPYLTETLPRLNTDDWRVAPDGRMQVTYRLRPNLTWHDGQPLTSKDFVFAHHVYTHPGPQHLLSHTSEPHGNPGGAGRANLRHPLVGPLRRRGRVDRRRPQPLPQHILERPFSAFEQDAAAREQFIQLPFWSTEYVGAGPVPVVRGEPGTSFEAAAHDGHPLGRPRIDRLHVRLFGDENTVLSNMLAGTLDYAPFLSMRIEQTTTLKREWDATGHGIVYRRQGGPSMIVNQLRPEYADPPAILDVRVRRALAHGIDRDANDEGVWGGVGFPSDSFVPTGLSHYQAVQRVMVHYPFDPRRAEALMTEAGYAKDRDGIFASGTGRLRFELKASAGTENERQLQIMAQVWQRAGFDVQGIPVPLAQARDVEGRHTFRSMHTRGGLNAGERSWTSAEIGHRRTAGGGRTAPAGRRPSTIACLPRS